MIKLYENGTIFVEAPFSANHTERSCRRTGKKLSIDEMPPALLEWVNAMEGL